MPGYVGNDGLVGAQPSSDIWVPSTDQNWPLGQMYNANDPGFGFGEFVYGKAAAAMGVGRCVYLTDLFVATDLPNTANTGTPVLFSAANMAINTYGWFRRAGMGPVAVNATVAAGVAIGVAAAGLLGTNAAGKQLLGARVLQSQLYAPTIANCQTQNGSKIIYGAGFPKVFVGLAVTGTGIPGSSTVTWVDPGGTSISLNNAATATGAATLTFTWTGFSLIYTDGAFIQGAIT
jgi:hypothetical protein